MGTELNKYKKSPLKFNIKFNMKTLFTLGSSNTS